EELDRFYCNETYDLIYVDVRPRDLARFWASTLPSVRALLNPGGHLVATLPIKETGRGAPTADSAAFAAYASEARKRSHDPAQFVSWCREYALGGKRPTPLAGVNQPVAGFEYATFALRLERDPLPLPFELDGRQRYFRLDDAMALFDLLRYEVVFSS